MSDQTFYLIKGLVALVCTVVVVVHMNLSWSEFDRDQDGIRTGVGQRMRYISWFLFIVLIAGASKEQIADGVEVSKRNVAALFVICFALLTAAVSIKEALDNLRRKH